MIGKVVVGTNFDKLLRYIESKDGAYRLDSNMAGNDIAQLGAEFKASAALRPGMSRCVWHTTLSVSPDESVSDSLWRVIARDYLQQLGFGQRQFVAYRHTDTEHHHIHIVASRIDLADGTVVSDSWNWPRSEAAVTVRSFEKQP